MGKKVSSNKSYEWESVDDDFFIWLFSNDKDVVKANDDDSIQSHFISKLPLNLDLRKGSWEMGVDKIILNNEQINQLDYKIKDPNGKIIKEGTLPKTRYFTKFEVVEEIYEIGEELRYDKSTTTKTRAKTLRVEDLNDEEIGMFGYDD